MRPYLSASTMPSRRGSRLLAELSQLRAGVAARIPAEPEILAAADDDDTDFQPHQMLWPSEAAVRFGLAVNTVRFLCRSTAGSTAIGAGDGLPGLQGLAIEPSGAPRLGEPAALAAAADEPLSSQAVRIIASSASAWASTSRPENWSGPLWPGSKLRHQRVSLALALLLPRGVAASAIASARALAKQL